MAFLKISLFGSFQIRWDENVNAPTLSPTIQGLFAYLLINRHRTHPREALAGLFWEDYPPQHARNCLNTAVWRLRNILEPNGTPAGTYLLSSPLGELGFNTQSDYWLDVGTFEEQARHTLAIPLELVCEEEIRMLENIIHLYIGDLLEGQYGDWALRERERMRCYYLNCLNYLMNYYANHNLFEASLEVGRQILSLDALREEVHRKMMHLYLKNGQRALAVRQYEQCCQALKSELNIAPMLETQRLYQHLLHEPSLAPEEVTPDHSSLDQAVDQLQNALELLDHAQQEVQKAAATVEKLVEHQGQTGNS